MRYTTQQVAERFGVSPDTVRRWIRAGHLEAINIGTDEHPIYRITANAIDKLEGTTRVTLSA